MSSVNFMNVSQRLFAGTLRHSTEDVVAVGGIAAGIIAKLRAECAGLASPLDEVISRIDGATEHLAPRDRVLVMINIAARLAAAIKNRVGGLIR